MSTWNRLDLQTLGCQPVMPKILPEHCSSHSDCYIGFLSHPFRSRCLWVGHLLWQYVELYELCGVWWGYIYWPLHVGDWHWVGGWIKYVLLGWVSLTCFTWQFGVLDALQMFTRSTENLCKRKIKSEIWFSQEDNVTCDLHGLRVWLTFSFSLALVTSVHII